MKKPLLFLSFVIALAAADRAVGLVLDRLYRRSLSGEMGGLINLALRNDADVLVLGSSRAQHHIDPAVLSKRLGLKAFNAGVDGQDFLYSMMLFDLWTARHPAPKAVILQVDPMTLKRSPEELQRASIFSPFIDRSALVRRILYSRGRYERLKYLSHAYRYNGKVLAVLKNGLSAPDPGFDGFDPLPASARKHGQAAVPLDAALRLPDTGGPFWDLKLSLFEKLDAYCQAHGTRLILVHSPHYARDSEPERRWLGEMRGLLARYPGVEFIDAGTGYARSFVGKPGLFKDAQHLNAQGAELFSKMLAGDLSSRLKLAARPKRSPLRVTDSGRR